MVKDALVLIGECRSKRRGDQFEKAPSIREMIQYPRIQGNQEHETGKQWTVIGL
jgi:hypothetical protein